MLFSKAALEANLFKVKMKQQLLKRGKSVPRINHWPQKTIKLLHLFHQTARDQQNVGTPKTRWARPEPPAPTSPGPYPYQKKERCNLRTTYPSSALNSAMDMVARLKPRVGQVAKTVRVSPAKEKGRRGRVSQEQDSKSGRQEMASCLSRRCFEGESVSSLS